VESVVITKKPHVFPSWAIVAPSTILVKYETKINFLSTPLPPAKNFGKILSPNHLQGYLMPDTWPEPYATIARMRKARLSDRRIAEVLGVSEGRISTLVRTWHRSNPERLMPLSDAELRADERKKIHALLRQGVHYCEVARRVGCCVSRVASLYARARKAGEVEALRKPPKDGYEAWKRQRASKAAPKSGTVPGMLARMTSEQYDALLRRQVKADKTLMDTVARLLLEALDEPR
jgi:transposase